MLKSVLYAMVLLTHNFDKAIDAKLPLQNSFLDAKTGKIQTPLVNIIGFAITGDAWNDLEQEVINPVILFNIRFEKRLAFPGKVNHFIAQSLFERNNLPDILLPFMHNIPPPVISGFLCNKFC